MEMGDRIRKLRQEAKLSQEELGAKLGLQKSAIAKYENGRVENLKRSMVEQMAQIFDVTPAYLMGWEASPRSNPHQAASLSAFSYASIGETTLLSHYRELNDTGKSEANKRIAELTQIQQYRQSPEPPIVIDPVTLRAAHERTDIEITPEMRQHDDDIMNDPNF